MLSAVLFCKTVYLKLRPLEVKTDLDSNRSEGGISFRQTAGPLDQNTETQRGQGTCLRSHSRGGRAIGEPGRLTLRLVGKWTPGLDWERGVWGGGASGHTATFSKYCSYLLIILQFIVQNHAVGLVWLGPRQGDAVHGAAHLVHNGHSRWCCKRGQKSGVKRGERSGVKRGQRSGVRGQSRHEEVQFILEEGREPWFCEDRQKAGWWGSGTRERTNRECQTMVGAWGFSGGL